VIPTFVTVILASIPILIPITESSRQLGLLNQFLVFFRRHLATPLLADCFGIIEVPIGFRQEEDVLMGFGTTVPDGFGHWRRLMPNNVLTEYPTISPKGQSYPPRSSNKITGRKIDSTSLPAHRLFPTLLSASVKTPSGKHITTTDFACTIGISEIQPESPVIPKHPMDQREYLYHLINELFGRLF